ncbi:DUF2029 domain-containing protein [Patescibacteria group bacterium]|nr:DUF2029 domain-containing protein [Patescibacteria group bacterium]
MKGHYDKYILGSVLVVIVALFFLVITVPDQIPIPVGDDISRVRLVRDDHELEVYFQRGGWLPQKNTPYHHEILQEYPQIGLAYISLPQLFSDEYGNYRVILLFFNLISFVFLIYFTFKIFQKLNKSSWYLLLFLLPSVVYFSFNRFDIFVALLVQLSLYLIIERRYRWSAIILAVAFLTKWYPILFIPMLILYLKNQVPPEEFKHLAKKYLFLFASVVFAVIVASFAMDGFYSLRPYLYHSARPGGVGSFYYLVFQSPFLESGFTKLNYLGLSVFFLLQFSVPIFVYIKSGIISNLIKSSHQLITWLALSVIIFSIFSRFYSPQWILWWLPLLILVINQKREIILLITLDVINFLAYPLIWQIWGPFSAAYIVISVVIVMLHFTIAWLVFRRIRYTDQSLI